MQLTCFFCNAPVSSPLPDDVILRGVVECPECMVKRHCVDVSQSASGHFSLWGKHGGHLEFVRCEIKSGEAHLIFTDHDVEICRDAPENGVYYRFILPLSEEGQVSTGAGGVR